MGQKLGQHFLKNKEKIKKIVGSLDLKRGDFVIEIGPGYGELTRELEIRSEKLGVKIIAIEKDPKLVNSLREELKPSGIEIIEGDALKILPELPKTYNSSNLRSSEPNGLKPETYKLVGNIPYYITGRLLRVLGELELKPKLIILTTQKEVAERICAEPPKMNLLAASVQFWAKPEIVDYIPKKDFKPQPKVDSAIIRLRTRDYESKIMGDYYKFIKILFKQPRKTILNNLASGLNLKKDEVIKKLGILEINPLDRPQNIDIATIQKLVRILYN